MGARVAQRKSIRKRKRGFLKRAKKLSNLFKTNPESLYSRLVLAPPDAPISPIPGIPIIAATGDSMTGKNRMTAAAHAIPNPAISRILF